MRLNYCQTIKSWLHYQNPRKVFREVKRVLNPKGKFFVIDFISHNRWSQYLNNWTGCPEHYHFEKYYTKDEIQSLAEAVNLKVLDKIRLGFLSGQYCFALYK